MIRGAGRDDDQVKRGRVDVGSLQRDPRRRDAHRCGGFVGTCDPPLDNACPLANPLVGSLHQLLELVVVHDAGWQEFAEATDTHVADSCGRHDAACPPPDPVASSKVINTSPACTSWPDSARIATIRPPRSARTSLKIFIVSIRPTTAPGATRSPTATNDGPPGVAAR